MSRKWSGRQEPEPRTSLRIWIRTFSWRRRLRFAISYVCSYRNREFVHRNIDLSEDTIITSPGSRRLIKLTSTQGCSFTGKFDLSYFTGKFTGNYRKLPKNKKIDIESHIFILNKLVNILSFFNVSLKFLINFTH